MEYFYKWKSVRSDRHPWCERAEESDRTRSLITKFWHHSKHNIIITRIFYNFSTDPNGTEPWGPRPVPAYFYHRDRPLRKHNRDLSFDVSAQTLNDILKNSFDLFVLNFSLIHKISCSWYFDVSTWSSLKKFIELWKVHKVVNMTIFEVILSFIRD